MLWFPGHTQELQSTLPIMFTVEAGLSQVFLLSGILRNTISVMLEVCGKKLGDGPLRIETTLLLYSSCPNWLVNVLPASITVIGLGKAVCIGDFLRICGFWNFPSSSILLYSYSTRKITNQPLDYPDELFLQSGGPMNIYVYLFRPYI